MLNGQSVRTTVIRVIFTAVFGGAIYMVLRKTGLLAACMLLHFLWDFSLITQGSLNESVSVQHQPTALLLAGLLNYVIIVLLLFAIPRLRTGERAPVPAAESV